MVIAVTNALHMLDTLVGKAITDHITEQHCSDYNAKSSSIKMHDKRSDAEYSVEITQDNLLDQFHLHAARYLYMIFDFKPLENKVFTAMQRDDTKTGLQCILQHLDIELLSILYKMVGSIVN